MQICQKLEKQLCQAQITAIIFKHLTEACSYNDSMTILFLDSALRHGEMCCQVGVHSCTPMSHCPVAAHSLWPHFLLCTSCAQGRKMGLHPAHFPSSLLTSCEGDTVSGKFGGKPLSLFNLQRVLKLYLQNQCLSSQDFSLVVKCGMPSNCYLEFPVLSTETQAPFK